MTKLPKTNLLGVHKVSIVIPGKLFCYKMLQFQLMTDKDRKEAAAIDKRRAAEEERKKRIFNPRARLFGIDYAYLDKQVEERRQREAEEKRIEDIFHQQLKKNDQIALALEKKEREERRKIQKEIDDFRRNFQKPEDRREYDLNDPNMMKKLLPMRLRDDDPRIGPSSVLKFEGEDISSDERAKVQREQIRSWLDQQMQEREAAEKERITAEEAYKAAVLARDQRALQLDQMEKDCRKRIEQACLRFNRHLADERECARLEMERKEKEDNMAEIYNTMTSDMMTENPEVAKSNLNPNKPIGFLYKGMTPDQLKEFKAAQQKQIEENKQKKADQARMEREFDDYINGIQKTIALLDKEEKRKKTERDRELAEENKRMGVEHRNHIEYLEKIVYRNRPTAAYYDQFNQGTR